ncbi:glutamyl-tRNA reductase [Microbacterium sp. cx-55]|uniref:glutamyl-tRNA reductase n=1 Tax=Microbacterium sp. cx-55 TaxID=2875948 RepID=UPI001CBF32A8|nr:glutamyl-tRNA reductase [Microbacterium sp. cx-55]MBZ4488300.1 glutamyl-tRNA reductase [Microbacterium sp. cx-55]UGB34959.1 glutamyl-tRNA reductase [Microbacterium sp. cx-55]
MLLCVSASHKTASFDLLERLSIHTTPIAPLIASHDECVQGAVVIATCNRFEAYVDMDEPVTAAGAVALEAAMTAIENATGVAADELTSSSRVISGDAVAEHLFAVAAGLESVVVGEGEIAGQVRRALTEARSDGTTSPELERLFQRASEAQRDVKNATALGRAGRSLVRLALDLATSRITDWSRQRVLLVGTGSYAAATLAALRDRGVTDVTVHSPSGRGEKFAHKHAIAWADRDAYPSAARMSDLIITCTTAEHHVLDAAILGGGATGAAGCPVGREGGRRLVIDLGLPRNVDPDVAGVPHTDLLDLETIRLHAPLEELQATDAARALVQDAARRFAVVGERRTLAPAVVALRSHATALLESEIERARAKGDDGRTEQALRHLMGRLLHTPTMRAHELAEQGRADAYLDALDALFGLQVDAASLSMDSPAQDDRTDLAG